jgi:hypothetical protein
MFFICNLQLANVFLPSETATKLPLFYGKNKKLAHPQKTEKVFLYLICNIVAYIVTLRNIVANVTIYIS